MLFKHKTGFTLIELLVVIAIIGLLSSMSVVVFNKVRRNAKAAKLHNEIRAIRDSMYKYYMDHGYFPSSISCDQFWCDNVDDDPWIPGLEEYLEKMPLQDRKEMGRFWYRRCRENDCADDNQYSDIYEIEMNIKGILPVDCPEFCEQYSDPAYSGFCYCKMIINCDNPSPARPCL